MPRRRIGIFGVDEDALRLWALLRANPDVDVVRLWDPDPRAARERALAVDPSAIADLDVLLTADVDDFASHSQLDVVIDSGSEPSFANQAPDAVERGLKVVSHLTARLLWAYGIAARDRKSELLHALSEVVESVDLTVHADELFGRMLEIAVGVTGADGGSLMLLDPDTRVLSIRVAEGVEPELWPKIRVPLGEGIAGKVAADAHPLHLRGKADQRHFHIVRERLDVESAICVPLVHGGVVLGVLNVHHSTRQDAFGPEALRFMEELGGLDAQIIARAQEHERLQAQAARYDAVREIQRLLTAPDGLPDRLQGLCRHVATRLGGGIATVYLHDPDEGDLRLAATSLDGGGFGGEYRVRSGQGVDGRAVAERRNALLRDEQGRLAYAALPLLAGERLLGLLTVQLPAGSSPGRAGLETLLEIAAALADGVARADRETRISSRATRVSAINEAGIRMISAASVDEVLRLATSSASMILEADHAVLRLLDEDSGRFVIRSYYGPGDRSVQEALFGLDKEASVRAIQARRALLFRDAASDEKLRPLAGEVRSFMSLPLKREGRTVGTLSVYDKVAADRFYAGRFNEDDLQVFAKFGSYVERAVDRCLFQAAAREHRNFDEETGLPNDRYLERRIQEEISRAVGREGALALTVCRIENLEELTENPGPGHAHRVLQCTAEALRSHLRDFDVVGRTGTNEFTVLMPEPGISPGERVFELARAVADAVSKDETLNEPQRVALAFGYAVHPTDGSDRPTLVARAGAPRIRMV